MAKVAKLVYVSFATRVVVDETATDEQILDAARPNFIDKVRTELGENLEEIVDDEEVPYDPNIELTPEELNKLAKEAEYDVDVVRIGYGFNTITVTAKNESEAEEKAIDIAGDFEFSEKNVDYTVDGVRKK